MRLLFDKTYDVMSVPLIGYDTHYNVEVSLENQVKDLESMFIQQGLDDKKSRNPYRWPWMGLGRRTGICQEEPQID